MNQLDPPYPLISKRLNEGKVIPFLGSGASLGMRQPPDAKWAWPREAGTGVCLPAANELASHLAQQTQFPEGEGHDLAKVAQYYDIIAGRSVLDQELHTIFNEDYSLTLLHKYLANVQSPLLIVTTNYDDLIERAFDEVNRPFDLVIHVTNPQLGDRVMWRPSGVTGAHFVSPHKLDIDLQQVTVIYKMHGTVDRKNQKFDQYVITEDDYIEFLARMTKNKAIPAIFAEPFQRHHFLFLGHGLYDWNLRVVLNRIEKDLRRQKGIRSWAIQRTVSLLESRFWQERGVEVYTNTIDDFVERLATY